MSSDAAKGDIGHVALQNWSPFIYCEVNCGEIVDYLSCNCPFPN